MTIHTPWETSESKTGLVNIGKYSLLAHVYGPRRKFTRGPVSTSSIPTTQHGCPHPRAYRNLRPDQPSPPVYPTDPLLIIEAGGGSTYTPYLGLIRLLASTHNIRTLAYNRLNLCGSSHLPPSTPPRTAVDIAHDFEALLTATGVSPPFILLAHSYSGVQIRTWMDVYNRWTDVEGCVFLDCATEDTYPRMPIRERDYGFLSGLPNVPALLGYDQSHKGLTEEEYKKLWEEAEQSNEKLNTDASAAFLKSLDQYSHRVLRSKPVSVIKGYLAEDLRKLVAEAERVGFGSEKQRGKVWENLEELDEVFESTERDIMRLSSNARMVWAPKEAGHAVIFRNPEIAVKEVAWAFEEWANGICVGGEDDETR